MSKKSLFRIVYRIRFNLRVIKNINYNYNYRSILIVIFSLQIISRIFLSIFYVSRLNAFNSVINIHFLINRRWFIRFFHANRASIIILLLIFHIRIKLYYRNYIKIDVWCIRVTILLLSILSAFLRYVLPWRQISFWRATVITNILTTVPVFRRVLVEWVWRRFSVSVITLTRFYTFHFIFPLVIIRLIIIHLFYIHKLRSSNPLNVWGYNKINFNRYFFIKDLVTVIAILIFLLLLVTEVPLTFIDADNWIINNPIVTPEHIKPEWYFLFVYRMLRSIPDKRLRVIVILLAILVFYTISLRSFFKYKTINFSNNLIIKLVLIVFSINYFILTYLRRMHVLPHYTFYNQILTIIYFLIILFILK